jgi:cellulose synthase/poly-beta-1,6-N-acetylglucosamine synthase-like glycosyltransferase
MMTAIALLVGFLRYIIGGIMRIVRPDIGVRKDYTNIPTVSILLPCYNEGKAVYDTIKSIVASDYPSEKLEIIVTDDCSKDDSWQWIQDATRDFPGVKAVQNEANQGKTKTILNALAMSKAEVVTIVDSDTLLHPRAIKELMACLADPRLGGVGGPASVRNPNDNALTNFQVYLYYLGFQLGKTIENSTRTVGVIGGYLFAIRRTLFEEIRPALEARNWFGVKVKDGEDRFITHQILLRGHGTYMDMSANCWTTVPNTFSKYWGQQLRWRRTTIRDFFYTIRRIPQHANELGMMSLYVFVLTPVIILVGIIHMVQLLLESPVAWASPDVALMYIAYSFAAVWLVSRFHPEQAVTNPIKLLLFCTWYIANNILLAPLALFTLDADGWGNRDISQLKGNKS